MVSATNLQRLFAQKLREVGITFDVIRVNLRYEIYSDKVGKNIRHAYHYGI